MPLFLQDEPMDARFADRKQAAESRMADRRNRPQAYRDSGIMNEDLLDRAMEDRMMRRDAEQYRNQMLREDYAIANSRRGNPNRGFYDYNPDVMARQFNNLQAGKLGEIYNQLDQGANTSDVEFEDGQALRDFMGFTNDLQLNPGNYDSMYLDEEAIDNGPGVIFDTDSYFTQDEAIANSPYSSFNQGQMERYGRENPRIINRGETAVKNDGSTMPVSNAVSLRDYETDIGYMNGEQISRNPTSFNNDANPDYGDLMEKFYGSPRQNVLESDPAKQFGGFGMEEEMEKDEPRYMTPDGSRGMFDAPNWSPFFKALNPFNR
jgi:hypothetical protein